MSVLAFKRPEPAYQWAQGEAFCIGCRHTWQAVSKTGDVDLECPSCGSTKGRYRFQFEPPEGLLRRVCDCGNDLFRLTPDGHMCANCGIYQRYE